MNVDAAITDAYGSGFTTNGSINSYNGGEIIIDANNFTNLTSNTLTGGIYEVGAGSTLYLYTLSTTTIQTLDADVILSGTGSVFTQYLGFRLISNNRRLRRCRRRRDSWRRFDHSASPRA